MTDCEMCGRSIIDTAYVDGICAGKVAQLLVTQSGNYAEMSIQIARLANFGEPTRFSGGEQPLPYDHDASITASSVDNTLTTWARHIAAERGLPAPHRGANTMLWLAEHLDWLRYRQEAYEALDELTYAARLVERCIDAPSPHWYAGPCMADGCDADLWARPNADIIWCRECGHGHDAAERKALLLRKADDVLGTATEVARFCTAMRGEPITGSMIRGLAFRGRIIAHGQDRLQRPTYRVGDVLSVLA